MTPSELHDKLGTSMTFGTPSTNKAYSDALSTLVTLLGDDKLEVAAGWFDYGRVEEYSDEVEAEIAVHARLLTPAGVITLDHDYSFDGAPQASFVPWSRVIEMTVIARALNSPVARNLWLETSSRRIEFAGIEPPQLLLEFIHATRRLLH